MSKNILKCKKVTFLKSSYVGGSRLEIPQRMKYSNIIDAESLPDNLSTDQTTSIDPDPVVHEIPASHWPPKDTPLLSVCSSANEVWDSCGRGSRRKHNRKPDNASNSASIGELTDELIQYEPSFTVTDNYEMRRILHKLERLPPDQREILLNNIDPQDFSPQDFIKIRTLCDPRAKEYHQMLQSVFLERGLGEPPLSEDPAVLSREIKRRLRIVSFGF